MANITGRLSEKKKRELLRSVTSLISGTSRMQAELEEGFGPHVLAGRLESMDLPDNVTIVLRPTLAFLHADLCLVAPGKVLVVNALHWSGPMAPGKKGEWTGAKGSVDLGRPDRRAVLFADRLQWSGLAKGLEVEPVVVSTAGDVTYSGGEPEARLVPWSELDAYLTAALPAGVAGFPTLELIKAITPK